MEVRKPIFRTTVISLAILFFANVSESAFASNWSMYGVNPSRHIIAKMLKP